jgi:hypothetical protein
MRRFCDELIARVTRTRASGVKLLRADSGFWNTEAVRRLGTAEWAVLERCAHVERDLRGGQAIQKSAWQTIEDSPKEAEDPTSPRLNTSPPRPLAPQQQHQRSCAVDPG